MINTKKDLLITHVFDAPRELVFRAWTDPEQLMQWYAPDDCTIEFRSIEVRPGGAFHSCVHDPVHGDCWIRGVYQVVDFPETLVFSMLLSDEAGNLVSSLDAGKTAEWPEALVTTVRFEALGEQTKITVHQTVDEAEAKKTGAYQSWIKMFYRLNRIFQP